MSINIVEQYINLTKKTVNEYMKLIFERKFSKKYCDMFNEKYINVRYYNFYEDDIGTTTRKKILNYLKKEEEEISMNNIDDRELIEQMRLFYYYVLYFDDVVRFRSLEEIIKKITKLRKKILGKETEDFEKNLSKIVIEYKEQKEELLKRFESDEFSIKITNYKDRVNVYRINLDYDIKFPLEYSTYAIKKAFTTGIIDEDRLIIEYYLTVVKVLRDVIKQNFKRHYVVEFTATLLEKPKKLKNLLKIIDEPMTQEKISIKIRYEDFMQNKDKVYELMREGYNFTVVLDKTFEVEYQNLEKLKMFKYVIVNRNLTYCEEIIGENVINI